MSFFDLFKGSFYKKELENTKTKLDEQILINANHLAKFEEIGASDYISIQEKINVSTNELNSLNIEIEKLKNTLSELQDLSDISSKIEEKSNHLSLLNNDLELINKNIAKQNNLLTTQLNKLSVSKEVYNALQHYLFSFNDAHTSDAYLNSNIIFQLENLCPSVILNLHCMDIRELRKAYKDNEKAISSILASYSGKYTTKANRTIYELMVMALRSELQNILYNLKYSKLDDAIDNVKKVTSKYFTIAQDGNQSISNTLNKFIGEIEYFFINAVKIEYNYYVKKEQQKQEQLALKQQMREEAEERKLLEAQQKKILQEESKYLSELEKVKALVCSSIDVNKTRELNARILELELQLSNVAIKKDEITKLQHGKAGSVYVISNLGSFGEDVFKIGMTRRLDPFDRINELGSASVPFRFDIHSLIFSDDAVALENKLHSLLTNQRVNKINLRKEFFKVQIDDLENLVHEIEPTAEFTKTMVAEQYRQSLSSIEN